MEDKLQLIYLHSTMLQDILQESLQANDDIPSPLDNTQALASELG